MTFSVVVERHLQPWKLLVCAGIIGYLVLAAATQTLRSYHWFLLLAIPGALLAAERGRRFFLDWAPLFAFWLLYDRLRLVQPLLLERVAVGGLQELEVSLFGWLAGGQVPAHAARALLAAHADNLLVAGLAWLAQLIYFSHLFLLPALLIFWWVRGKSRVRDRARFVRAMRGFTLLNALGLLGYILVPAAPPWWVSLYGLVQPSAELVAQAQITAAMDGPLIQSMIATAPNWFAAMPSMHGAYPVFLFLLAWREYRWWVLATIVGYGLAMWTATVLLNQHYIIDLVVGGLLAVTAASFFRRPKQGLPG